MYDAGSVALFCILAFVGGLGLGVHVVLTVGGGMSGSGLVGPASSMPPPARHDDDA